MITLSGIKKGAKYFVLVTGFTTGLSATSLMMKAVNDPFFCKAIISIPIGIALYNDLLRKDLPLNAFLVKIETTIMNEYDRYHLYQVFPLDKLKEQFKYRIIGIFIDHMEKSFFGRNLISYYGLPKSIDEATELYEKYLLLKKMFLIPVSFIGAYAMYEFSKCFTIAVMREANEIEKSVLKKGWF